MGVLTKKAGTTFRVILVSFFIGAVVNGHSSNWNRQGDPNNNTLPNISPARHADTDFIKNLKLSDIAFTHISKVTDEVVKGVPDAVLQLQILNILDDLSQDELCPNHHDHGDKLHYQKLVAASISEVRSKPMEVVEKIRKKIRHIQGTISNIRYLIQITFKDCQNTTEEKDCNNIINLHIVESDDRDILFKESDVLESISKVASTFLKEFKTNFDKAVAMKNVFNHFLTSENEILTFVAKLVELRKLVKLEDYC